MRRYLQALAVILILVGAVAHAQDAAPTTGANRWHFQLEPQFFASPDAEVEARVEVQSLAAQVSDAAARLETPTDLLAALAIEDRMQRTFRRHDLYLFLHFAIDTSQTDGLEAADEMRLLRGTASRALAAAIAAKPESWITEAIESEPSLARYRYNLETIRAEAANRPSSETETAIAAFAPLHSGRDYSSTVRGLVYPMVMIDGDVVDYLVEQSRIETHPDAEIRADGERAFLAGYATQRDLFAHLLSDSIAGANASARLRGFDDAIGQAVANAHVTRANYRALLNTVSAHADVFKVWDARSDDPFASERCWSVDEAVSAIIASARSLGPAYADSFAALLDPANGRADFAGEGDRLPLRGTASVYPIGTSAIYMQDYGCNLLDVIVMAHEGGHAVQADLMYANRVPMMQAAGPGYFTESFGRFQELVLLDSLYRTSDNEADRSLFRDALAARLLSIFNSAEEAAIELAIHEAVGDGQPLTADRLDSLTAQVGTRYANAYAETPELQGIWMASEGYYMAPMQELNDAYASLLAVRYYQAWRTNPQSFATVYGTLLARGYDASPAEMLDDALGLDILDDDFANSTLADLDAEITLLYEER